MRDVIDSLPVFIGVILVVIVFLWGIGRSISIYADCEKQGGVVVKVVEWGDGLACVGEDR